MSNTFFARKPIAVVIGALLSTTTFSAFSETANNSETTSNSETIQVWGTEINSDSSLLSDDIVMKQADHLSDLLRDQAGVDVGGTHSMNQGINIRGVSELDLNITIDGASQTNNVFHHAGNLLINPDIIKAVDLQVGNNSVLNSGLGGGVAFETKDAKDLLKPDQRVGARLFGGIASNDYYQYSATLYSQFTDTVDGLAYFSTMDRDNPKDGNGTVQVGEDGEITNYLMKLGWDANEANRFEVSYDNYSDEGDYTLKSNMGQEGFDQTNYIMPIEYSRETIVISHELALENTDVKTSVYRNEMNYQTTNKTSGDVTEGNVEVYGLKTLAETSLELAGMYHTVRYGAEGKMEESKNLTNGQVKTTSGGDPSTENADTVAIYVEDEIELTNGWYVTPGARYNHYKLDMLASDNTFKDTIFALATKYEITDQWTARASATELFKGPGLTGSFLTSNSDYNPDLKAETGVNYEAAIAYQASHVANLDRLGFSFTVFETHIDDYIDDTVTGKVGTRGPGAISNEGDVEITGFESVLSMKRGNMSGRVTYSHSDSEFTRVNSSSSYVIGQALDDVGDSISFNLGYEAIDLGLNIGWTSLFTMDLTKDVEADKDKEGYDVHSINMQWTPTAIQDLSIMASVENIFDEQYASHASRDSGVTDYEPGRNFKLSVAYQF